MVDICVWNVWVGKYAATKVDRHLRDQSNHCSSFGRVPGRQAFCMFTNNKVSINAYNGCTHLEDAVCSALFVLVKYGGHLLLDAEGTSEDTSPEGMQWLAVKQSITVDCLTLESQVDTEHGVFIRVGRSFQQMKRDSLRPIEQGT
jgi:hypothetical protein